MRQLAEEGERPELASWRRSSFSCRPLSAGPEGMREERPHLHQACSGQAEIAHAAIMEHSWNGALHRSGAPTAKLRRNPRHKTMRGRFSLVGRARRAFTLGA